MMYMKAIGHSRWYAGPNTRRTFDGSNISQHLATGHRRRLRRRPALLNTTTDSIEETVEGNSLG